MYKTLSCSCMRVRLRPAVGPDLPGLGCALWSCERTAAAELQQATCHLQGHDRAYTWRARERCSAFSRRRPRAVLHDLLSTETYRNLQK